MLKGSLSHSIFNLYLLDKMEMGMWKNMYVEKDIKNLRLR